MDSTAVLKEQYLPWQELASGQLELIEADATRFDIAGLVTARGGRERRWKVVANLPFNITTAVLKTLLPMGDLLTEILVMLQVSLLPKR